MTDELEGNLLHSQNSGMKMDPSGWAQGPCVEEILINFTRDSMFRYVKSNGLWDAAQEYTCKFHFSLLQACCISSFCPLGVMIEPSLVSSSSSRIRLGNWSLLPFSITIFMFQRVRALQP